MMLGRSILAQEGVRFVCLCVFDSDVKNYIDLNNVYKLNKARANCFGPFKNIIENMLGKISNLFRVKNPE
jgi:hypothetical protein